MTGLPLPWPSYRSRLRGPNRHTHVTTRNGTLMCTLLAMTTRRAKKHLQELHHLSVRSSVGPVEGRGEIGSHSQVFVGVTGWLMAQYCHHSTRGSSMSSGGRQFNTIPHSFSYMFQLLIILRRTSNVTLSRTHHWSGTT